jgi:hypothetical protein
MRCTEFRARTRPATENHPGLAPALKALVDPQTRGDPEPPLVWTTKSSRNLADALAAGGHRVSDRTDAARAGIQLSAGQR